MKLRITVTDMWDTVDLEVSGDSICRDVKVEALTRTVGAHAAADEYVVKFRGATIFNEGATLASLKVPDGGSLIVLRDRRRPVR